MHPKLAAVAAAHGGVFAAWQAREHGYCSEEIGRLVKSGQWVALRRGIYAESALVEAANANARYLLNIAAALLAIRGLAGDARLVASHDSAVVLWGLETLETPALGVVRLTTSSRVHRAAKGLRISAARLPEKHVAECSGLAVTAMARTVVDMARETPYRAGVALADCALRSGVTKPDLEQVLRDCWNWPGIRQAARVVAFADHLAESVAESLARVVVAEAGLPAPRPQARISDADGVIARVDLLFEEQRTILEVDGKLKYVDPDDD
jgi:hypothetical protein